MWDLWWTKWHCDRLFSQYFFFPCQYHSNDASYPFIHLPPTLYNVSLPVLQFSPVSIIPPMLHTHSFTYHPHYIMFLSQYFCFPPVSIIPPMLHTIHIYMLLLPEEQTCESWEPSTNRHSFGNWAALERKVFPFLQVSATSPAVVTCPNGSAYTYNNGRSFHPGDRVPKILVNTLKPNSYFMY